MYSSPYVDEGFLNHALATATNAYNANRIAPGRRTAQGPGAPTVNVWDPLRGFIQVPARRSEMPDFFASTRSNYGDVQGENYAIGNVLAGALQSGAAQAQAAQEQAAMAPYHQLEAMIAARGAGLPDRAVNKLIPGLAPESPSLEGTALDAAMQQAMTRGRKLSSLKGRILPGLSAEEAVGRAQLADISQAIGQSATTPELRELAKDSLIEILQNNPALATVLQEARRSSAASSNYEDLLRLMGVEPPPPPPSPSPSARNSSIPPGALWFFKQ